jgi:hypothetical protein
MKEMQTYVFVVRAEKPYDAAAWNVGEARDTLKKADVFNTTYTVKGVRVKPGQAFYLEVSSKGRINKSVSGLKVVD